MKLKPIMTAREAVRIIKEYPYVGIPTFYHVGVALDLVNALADQGTKNLRIISNDPGLPGLGTGRLIRNGQVKLLIVSFIGTNKEAVELYLNNKLQILMYPQGTLVTKLWAGASGIGGFLTKVGIDTKAERWRRIKHQGADYILESPLRAEVALVKAWKADRMGNVIFHNAGRNFNDVVAKASDFVIVEADEILPEGQYLDPNFIHLPFCYTDILVQSSGQWREELKVIRAQASAELSPERLVIVKRAAKLLEDGDIVNLGIGTPVEIARFIPEGITVHLMSENGILGMGPPPPEGEEDPEICNAGRGPATIQPGGAFFDSFEAFNMIGGGKIDKTILGAFEVDERGSLANYEIPGKRISGIGGGMNLVTGAKEVIIATEHTSRGKSKIVKKCSLPLTGKKVVKRIVTELALIEVTPEGLVLRETAPGITIEEVVSKTEARLIIPEKVEIMDI